MIDKLRSLKLHPRTNSQKGFTLIELMVVISILGILAAVVTISMIGITTTAQKQANTAELKTVQVALDTLIEDPSVGESALAVCTAGGAATSDAPTNDMQNKFPAGSTHLYPNYLHQQTTHIKVWCDSNGVVFSNDPHN